MLKNESAFLEAFQQITNTQSTFLTVFVIFFGAFIFINVILLLKRGM
jgi:hypothetical protein